MTLPDPLAGYEDWPVAVREGAAFAGPTASATELGRILGLRRLSAPPAVRREGRRRVGPVEVETVRWSVGYGPATTGWLLRPAGVHGDLPAAVGLHAHGGVRSVGGEQLVDLGDASSARAVELRDLWYSGRAPANELARRGVVVLVHDAFSWGSRRFDLSHPTPRLVARLKAEVALAREQGRSLGADERFDLVSGWHEDRVAKSAGVLGQTFAGAVLTDDLIALDLLAAMPGVDAGRLSTFGFSGGGGRALLLAALDHRVSACVVACMMATYASLVPRYLDSHSWLLHVPGLWSFADWPDLTTLARSGFLVQYRSEDELFPREGMQAAHERLAGLHAGTGAYSGSFHAGGHTFDAVMQEEAIDFLLRSGELTGRSRPRPPVGG